MRIELILVMVWNWVVLIKSIMLLKLEFLEVIREVKLVNYFLENMNKKFMEVYFWIDS